MTRVILYVLAFLFFACGGSDQRDDLFHPDAQSLQVEALKVYHRKPDSALSILDKAIQMDPSFYLAYNTKAMVLIKQQRFEQAIAELYKSLRWRDDQAEVFLQLGMLNDLISAPERANDAYEQAIALFENRLSVTSEYRTQDQSNRAISLIMRGEVDKGNQLLDDLAIEHPESPFIIDLQQRRTTSGEVLDKEFYIKALLLDKH